MPFALAGADQAHNRMFCVQQAARRAQLSAAHTRLSL